MNDGIDAHITHRNAGTEVLRQHGSPGLCPGQIDGLHQGHRLGGTGNALFHNAVVRGKHKKVGLVHGIMDLSGDACQLNGQFLQPPQTLGGFGKRCLPKLRGGHSLLRERLNGCK